MLEVRGKRIWECGPVVNDMIARLNTEYPADRRVALWFVNDEFLLGPEGTEYGVFVDDRRTPCIFVAVKGRTQEQIAGIIAMQYAIFLQRSYGAQPDIDAAVEFAKYMNGNRPKPPDGLVQKNV